jgi:tetratricopeptide (TPR) repeat protein
MILYFVLFNILLRHPYILVAVVLFYIFRDRIPSPSGYFKRQRAFARLRQSVSVNPHDSTARRDLGLVLLDKNMPKEALTNFLEALKKEDSSAEINHFTGLSYLRSGNPEKAAEHLRKAATIEPRLRYGESHLYLGEAYLAMNRPEDALESLKTFLSINSSSIEGLYSYARALNALGRKEEARKAVEEGVRYHKANPSFRRRRDWRWYVKLKGLRRGM